GNLAAGQRRRSAAGGQRRRPALRPQRGEAARPIRAHPPGGQPVAVAAQERRVRRARVGPRGMAALGVLVVLEHAEPGWDPGKWRRSVKSGHTNSEIAHAPPATWNSDASSDAAERRLTGPARDEWQGPDDKQLDALAGMTGDGQWSIRGRRVRLSNLDKTLFP